MIIFSQKTNRSKFLLIILALFLIVQGVAYTKGIAEERSKDEDPALSVRFNSYLEAEKLHSSDCDVYYNLACVYSIRGDLDNAVNAMNKAVFYEFKNFHLINQDDNLINFRTTAWWSGIAANFRQIENLLNELEQFSNKGDDKSFEEKRDFYTNVINNFDSIAPYIPVLKYSSLSSLGFLYYNIDDFIRVIQYWKESAIIKKNVLGEDHPEYGVSLNNLGVVSRNMSDYESAAQYYLESKKIIEKTSGTNSPSYATALGNLGGLYFTIGDYEKAEQCYLETQILEEKLIGAEHPGYATTLNNLGVLYRNMGDHARTEQYYLRALQIREKVFGKEHSFYAASLSSLGILYNYMRDYDKAKIYYMEALELREKINGKSHPAYADCLNHLGFLYFNMKDYAQSEVYYLEAMNIREKTLGKNHAEYANSLNNLGGLYERTGDFEKAESFFLEALSNSERLFGKEHPAYINILDNLYKFYITIKEYDKALLFKNEAFQLNKNQINRMFSFLSEQQREAYWNANALSFEISYSLSLFYPVSESNALNYDNALFSKSLLLRTTNAVRDAIYSSGNQELIGQFEELNKLRRQISRLKQNRRNEELVKIFEQQIEALDKSLTQNSAGFRDFQSDLVMNWQNVRGSLNQNEAAVEFVSFKIYDKNWTYTTQYAALILRPGEDSPEWIPLCEESALAALFEPLKGMHPDDMAQLLYNENGSILYDTVWKPLEKELEGINTVFYSPSGLLHKVSFNAIPIEGKRLMDVYNLNLVSSTREVVSLRTRTSQTPAYAVVYGGLDYDTDEENLIGASNAVRSSASNNEASTTVYTRGFATAAVDTSDYQKKTGNIIWNYLPFTDIESRDILKTLNDNRIPASLYSEEKGSKESFLALDGGKTGIIHLATHGFFNHDIQKNYEEQERTRQPGSRQIADEHPLRRSGLIMSGANTWAENGVLTAEEVAGLNLLGAELVVLSACETALGEVDNSEGVFGLQRAFKLAGAQTLVMSLWEVDDTATSILMSSFYENWLSGKSRQEAFRGAQKTLKADERYASPFFWAAFVMMD